MIAKLKAKLRAWMIDLVREAIRVELCARDYAPIAKAWKHLEEMPPFDISSRAVYPGRASKPVTATVTAVPDKSFEQMQADSIAAQEKYYEPRPEA